jgi:tetratricopeptide (TPR) repeat protein
MILRKTMTALLLTAALAGLAGCEDSKEKAARHLASALELAEKGDAPRAQVEFLNVFQLDPENLEARRAYAKFLETNTNLPSAYGQYLAIIERQPEDQEALRAAARLAARLNNWGAAGDHAKKLLTLVPEDAAAKAVLLGADYAEAVSRGNQTNRDKAASAARSLLRAHPDDMILNLITIDSFASSGDTRAALAATDAALKQFPEELALYGMRVNFLAALNDKPATEATLLDMDKRFHDPAVFAMVLRWYISNKDLDKAEAWLREKSAPDTPAGLSTQIQLVLFLQQFRSPEAALAEIDKALPRAEKLPAPDADSPDAAALTTTGLKVLRASILFERGDQDTAIKEMQALVAEGKATDEIRMAKVTLARMLQTKGDKVQAQALVDAVLAEDSGHVEAIKMKAVWAIEADDVDTAVALLRKALETEPRNAVIMSILAEAYSRSGARDLEADMLARAVEASGKAPTETLKYANFLVGDQKFLPAETLIVDALRLAPNDIDLLAGLGDLYLRMKDWPRAEGVAARLEEIGTPAARNIAGQLRPQIYAGRDNVGAAVRYLEEVAAGSGALSDQFALISAYLSDGKTLEARNLAQKLVTENPDSREAAFALAAVKGATDDGTGAIADLRALVTKTPTDAGLWVALLRQTIQTEGQPAAVPVIEEALKALPDQPDLLLMKASSLEARQDIDGAIAIYEGLYAKMSDNLIVANNLASLVASYKTDQPSLDRAWAVARRLNGTDVPAFADTYGWLAHLRGQSAEALPYMETALTELAGDPMVQFHMAEVLKALGKTDEARTHYAEVLKLVEPNDSRAFVEQARIGAK